MGYLRFHRSIGNRFFRLNVSKTGLSVTGGVPGAHVNVPLTGRKRRPMGTLGVPGTGLSYRQQLDNVPRRYVWAFAIGAAIFVLLWWGLS